MKTFVCSSPVETNAYSVLEDTVAGCATVCGPKFITSANELATGLFELYLSGLPEDRRQHYNCNTCRRFIERYGGLCTLSDAGQIVPMFWRHGHQHDFFRLSIESMHEAVRRAKIVGVFLSSEPTFGIARTGDWSHLHCNNVFQFYHPLKNADQMMAEKREDYVLIKRTLAEVESSALAQAVRVLEADAVRVLEADALSRSEKALGAARWLLALKQSRIPNKEWLAVATAPEGFCHAKNNILGTLLADIVAGMSMENIQRRWAEKTHPLQYQRPTALSDGNITQANKQFEALGATGSLRRRFAYLSDIKKFLWIPSPSGPEVAEIAKPFDILKPKAKALELPPKTLTWEKFRKDVLPIAVRIECRAPQHGNYGAFVTAVDPDAPNMLQWNNTVSWYVYHNGSSSTAWGLDPHSYVEVVGVSVSPPHWDDETAFSHIPAGAMLLLNGAMDKRRLGGSAIFPECLRSEYREVRKAIDKYSEVTPLEGEGNACGLLMMKSGTDHIKLRVHTASGIANYVIDRWE